MLCAQRWLGTPFHHQASLRYVGVDCIGLIVGVARDLGLPGALEWAADKRYRGYSREPNPVLLEQACDEYLDVPTGPERLGDVLLLTYAREPMHFGFVSCLDPRQMIHAYGTVGRVVENGIDAKWQRRMIRRYRLRGLEA